MGNASGLLLVVGGGVASIVLFYVVIRLVGRLAPSARDQGWLRQIEGRLSGLPDWGAKWWATFGGVVWWGLVLLIWALETPVSYEIAQDEAQMMSTFDHAGWNVTEFTIETETGNLIFQPPAPRMVVQLYGDREDARLFCLWQRLANEELDVTVHFKRDAFALRERDLVCRSVSLMDMPEL